MEKQEMFALVELFGHTKIAGRISDHAVGSSMFVRIDVPETKTVKQFSRIINPSAIYSITPVSEVICNEMANIFRVEPLNVFEINSIKGLSEGHYNDIDDDDDFNEEDVF